MNISLGVFAAAAMAAMFTLANPAQAGGDNQIAKWDLPGFIMKNKVQVLAFNDPEVSGVTCYVTNIDKAFSLTDPSNSSIACRKVGPVVVSDGVDRSDEGEVVFTERQSPFFKKLRVRRVYDTERNVLIYVSYTTKAIDGSFKVSTSAISLYSGDAN